MKIRKKTILLGLIILLSSFIMSTSIVQAKKPDRTVITFEYKWVDPTGLIPPKKEWTTDKGILHTLQTPHYGCITSTGDLQGDLYYCGNLILDLVTFSGKGGGIFEFTGTYKGELASFRGKLIFDIEELELTGTLNCPGSGAFKNVLLKGTVYTVLFVYPVTYVTMTLWT